MSVPAPTAILRWAMAASFAVLLTAPASAVSPAKLTGEAALNAILDNTLENDDRDMRFERDGFGKMKRLPDGATQLFKWTFNDGKLCAGDDARPPQCGRLEVSGSTVKMLADDGSELAHFNLLKGNPNGL